MKSKLQIKKDKYKSSRGGYSRLLDIYCRKCNNLVLVYQKDGPGNLRRLYLDRIFEPDNLVNLQKEKRKTFRIFQDAVTKNKHLTTTK